jgi:hypothetical protein
MAVTKYRFAGVSVMYDKPSPGIHQPHFHITKLEKQIAVWMKVPGKAMYTYIELPREMTKLEAIRYLATAKEFQEPKYVHDYLIRLAALRDPERREEMLKEEKEHAIAKIKRTRKARTSSPVHMMEEATFGDDDLDEDDIPEALKESKNED